MEKKTANKNFNLQAILDTESHEIFRKEKSRMEIQNMSTLSSGTVAKKIIKEWKIFKDTFPSFDFSKQKAS